MAVRTKPAAAAALTTDNKPWTIVSLHQTDPDGQYVLEQSLWDVTKREHHAILAQCVKEGSSQWPQALIENFIELRKHCERPEEPYDGKRIARHYQITLSHRNDDLVDDASEDEGESDIEEESGDAVGESSQSEEDT
jgi:hypothetical protein